MSSVTPLVVTHPCALVRDGLRKILGKSHFRPVQILPSLDNDAENFLVSAGICIWLVGVNECGRATNNLIRRVYSANPSLRVVILTGSHTADDIFPAFQAGACGFLRQDIPSKQLIKSLELIALGESVMHPRFQQMVTSGVHLEIGESAGQQVDSDRKAPQPFPPMLADLRSFPADDKATANGHSMTGNDIVRSLSRRE